MQQLQHNELQQVTGAGYGKDEAARDAVVLVQVYYDHNPGLSPTSDDLLELTEELADRLKKIF